MHSGFFSVGVSMLALWAAAAQAQPASFHRVPGDFLVEGPVAVAVGDFDKDGNLDAAVPSVDLDEVSVLWGAGDGSFLQYCAEQPTQSCRTNSDCQSGTCNPPGITITTGIGPMAVAVGDFNNDGLPDIVTADSVGNTVSVLLNQGGRAFGDSITTDAGSSPVAVVVGDFNADDNLDVATANSLDNTVTVLLGTGDGNFDAAPAIIPVDEEPSGLATADLNGDHVLDLVVTNSSGGASGDGSLSVLLGTGAGDFTEVAQPAVPSTVFSVPFAVAIGNVNGDDIPDLIVANDDDDSAAILLGNGDGTFHPVGNVDVGASPESVVAGDFNGDGKLDFATGNYFGDSVSVASGNGDGTFAPAVDFAVGAGPLGVAAGDLNGDGKLDIVSANNYDGSVSVLLNITGACVGDCDGGGDVSINELITMVNIALGGTPVSACTAGDADGSGTIEINEIITAVNHALNGCPAASPTGTPAATATPTRLPTPTPTPT